MWAASRASLPALHAELGSRNRNGAVADEARSIGRRLWH
jgi:hypothetical protein